MKNILKLILVGIASTIAIKLNAYLVEQNFNSLFSVILSAVAGSSFVKLSDYFLFEFPMKFPSLRKYVDDNSKYEGIWIHYLYHLKDRPLSIACIEYNQYSKKYRYYGKGLDENGQLKATWESVDLIINLEKDEINYLGQGQLFDEQAETIMSYGQLKFAKGINGKYENGTGFFVDFGTQFFKTKFVMQKVELPSKVFSKGYGLPSDEEIKKIAQEFNNKISQSNE